jgi:hypothetical protein
MDWLAEHECTPLAFDYHLDDHTVLMTEDSELALRRGQFPERR